LPVCGSSSLISHTSPLPTTLHRPVHKWLPFQSAARCPWLVCRGGILYTWHSAMTQSTRSISASAEPTSKRSAMLLRAARPPLLVRSARHLASGSISWCPPALESGGFDESSRHNYPGVVSPSASAGSAAPRTLGIRSRTPECMSVETRVDSFIFKSGRFR
jgi:hypothetical protein